MSNTMTIEECEQLAHDKVADIDATLAPEHARKLYAYLRAKYIAEERVVSVPSACPVCGFTVSKHSWSIEEYCPSCGAFGKQLKSIL